MKPPTPAMLAILRVCAVLGDGRDSFTILHGWDKRTVKGLVDRGLIAATTKSGPKTGYQWKRWTLTDEGRRVLAEHTTTGDE